MLRCCVSEKLQTYTNQKKKSILARLLCTSFFFPIYTSMLDSLRFRDIALIRCQKSQYIMALCPPSPSVHKSEQHVAQLTVHSCPT